MRPWVVELVGNDRHAYLGYMESVQNVWMMARCYKTREGAMRLVKQRLRWAARNGWMMAVVKMRRHRQRLRHRERL